MATPPVASYRALFAVRDFGRVVMATAIARLSGQMWEIVLVLFVLARFHSTVLAGLAVLLAALPGLVISPVAGALLDRQGRVRLMVLDYSVTAALTATIVALSLTHHLSAALLLILVALLSISNILSITGARSLFPLMLPNGLWDRANGLDTSIYSLVSVIGPAIAGLVVARFNPEAGLLLIAATAAIAAVCLIGVGEPVERVAPTRSLVQDAWSGLTYVVRHRSLRGLAIAMFLWNLGAGVLPVGIPVLVIRELHGSAATVGQVFAVFGLAGLVAGLLIGRVNTLGREPVLMATSVALQVPVLVGLAFLRSLPVVFLAAAVSGALISISNVALFALRQRRTHPEWFGRAFAVSMSLNYSGQPIGSAISGPLLARSIALPMLLGAAITLVAVPAMLLLIPGRDDPLAPKVSS
jgi:MFS family permease